MELTGMVALGEYSDGRICEIPARRASPGADGSAAAAVATMTAMTLQRQAAADLQAPPQ
jgi:hypothetical protein